MINASPTKPRPKDCKTTARHFSLHQSNFTFGPKRTSSQPAHLSRTKGMTPPMATNAPTSTSTSTPCITISKVECLHRSAISPTPPSRSKPIRNRNSRKWWKRRRGWMGPLKHQSLRHRIPVNKLLRKLRAPSLSTWTRARKL